VVQVREYCSGIEYFEADLEAIYYADGRVFYNNVSSEGQFVLSDYQGNNRILFKDGGGTAEIVEDYSGYYPLGGLHKRQSDYSQKYLFGGKELQTELDLGWSDFGVRCFDNWSGKWLGIDIMSEVKPNISPYAYGLGNPIRFSDPTGMIEEDGSVSTSLWGRDVTGGENSGEVLNSNFLSSGQLSRDLTNVTGGDGQSFLITGKNRNKSSGETDWALEGVFQLAKYTSSLSIIEASGSRDAYNQLKEFTDGGGTIGNLIFDSHGTYNSASFKVGNSKAIGLGNIGRYGSLRQIGGLLSENSEVCLLACHAGSNANRGEKLAKTLSVMIGAPVYASASWTGAVPGMFNKTMSPSISATAPGQTQTGRNGTLKKTNAIARVGRWIRATPDGNVERLKGRVYIGTTGHFSVRQISGANGYQKIERFGEY